MCKTSGGTDPADLASFGEEDDGSMKLKEHVRWWEAEFNENERRDFPPGPEGTELDSALPWKILSQARRSYLEKEGQAR